MTSHYQRIRMAKALTGTLAKKYKDIVFIGVYGSVARGDDDSYSDIDLLVVTGKRKLGIRPFIFRSVPVMLTIKTKKEALEAVKKIDELWPAEAGKYFYAKPLYGGTVLQKELKKVLKTTKKKEFDTAASSILVGIGEDVGKIKNAASRKLTERASEYAIITAYFFTLFVALLNRKYYKRDGARRLEEARSFKKLPEKYVFLMNRLYRSKSPKELAITAQKLYDNCLDIAKQNKIPERHFWDTNDAV